jgi:uncharacterized protein (TIGR02145 family)
VDGSNGGVVTLSNGTSITFPTNAVKNPSTGSLYSGTVSVSAHYIDPTAEDIAGIMPGDLRGLRENGDLNVLVSYGMLVVELNGSAGENLQVADGKKATLSMSIPNSLTSSAPATIPLWYFDEVTGLWKEEGAATKVGNQYVGDVSHFSYWNCDIPRPHVPYHCRLLYSDGSPASNVEVVLTDVNYNGGGTNHGFTDANGDVFGGAPANAQVRMEVRGLALQNCVIIYTTNFSTGYSAVEMGDLTIGNSTVSQANITGSIKNCNNLPITNGRVIFAKNGVYQIYKCNSEGEYNFVTYLCNGSFNSQIIAQDLSNGTQFSPINQNIIAGNNVIPNIVMCGTLISQISTCNQIWMSRNLDVDHYKNGDLIPHVQDPATWANLTTGAWCYYGNDSINGFIYGKMYNCYAVMDPRGLAPDGWHIPSKTEWDELISCNGGTILAFNALKEAGNAHWNSVFDPGNTNATNSSGFTALPAGLRVPDGGYTYLNQNAFWWTTTPSGNNVYYQQIGYGYQWNVFNFPDDKRHGKSVRCIKD